jgi:hypothetical protein
VNELQKRNNVMLRMIVPQWFLTIFTYNLPFPSAVRVWDWIFVEGHDVVFPVALAILACMQREYSTLDE